MLPVLRQAKSLLANGQQAGLQEHAFTKDRETAKLSPQSGLTPSISAGHTLLRPHEVPRGVTTIRQSIMRGDSTWQHRPLSPRALLSLQNITRAENIIHFIISDLFGAETHPGIVCKTIPLSGAKNRANYLPAARFVMSGNHLYENGYLPKA